MTPEELQKAIEPIVERLQKNEWMFKDIPQIDRKKIIEEINERLTQYAMYGWGENQKSSSAYAEERGENDEK